MSSVEELRAQVMAATQLASDAMGYIQQAFSNVEQASMQIQQAQEGSSMADWAEGNGGLMLCLDALRTAQETNTVAIQSLENVANRL